MTLNQLFSEETLQNIGKTAYVISKRKDREGDLLQTLTYDTNQSTSEKYKMFGEEIAKLRQEDADKGLNRDIKIMKGREENTYQIYAQTIETPQRLLDNNKPSGETEKLAA